MALFYPVQRFGRFGVGYGLTPGLLHRRFGLDFGERFHRDIAFRVQSVMDADRAVSTAFGELGIGFREPFPRATIEPFGHRFVPAVYGCECVYASDAEPAGRPQPVSAEEIAAFPPWTPERFEACPEVKLVLEQAAWVREHCDAELARRRTGFIPHYQPLTSLQNLGSVINNAFTILGDAALSLYLDDPLLLGRLYGHLTDFMLLCLERFSAYDGRRLEWVFVGDCTVAMISPAQYAGLNLAFDRRLAQFAASVGARFLVHQDSGATPHLANYARLGAVAALDLGQDTDFAEATMRFPKAAVNCIVFPSWIRKTPAAEMEEELGRLLRAGAAFPEFTCAVFDVDPDLAEGRIFEFHAAFRRVVERFRAP